MKTTGQFSLPYSTQDDGTAEYAAKAERRCLDNMLPGAASIWAEQAATRTN